MSDTHNNTLSRSQHSSVLTTNSVLRNTYLLLSLTLLFSAAIAGLAMHFNAPPVGIILFLIGGFGLMFLTQALRNSPWGLLSVFLFTGFMGYVLGPILNVYLHQYVNGSSLITTSLGMTGLVFMGLSAYALNTKRDFSFLSGFMVAGGIVLMVAIVASIFIRIPAFQLAISAAIVLFASASILFETSRIVQGGETNYISATVSLYLSLFNLFINLLNLLAAFSGNSRN